MYIYILKLLVMKTVRTITGTKRIPESDTSIILIRLKEFLEEHRDALINRLVSNLDTYLDYKFHIRVSSKQLEEIKEKLYYIRSKSIDLSRYSPIVQMIMSRETSHVNLAPFYQEIDDSINWYLNTPQLKLQSTSIN